MGLAEPQPNTTFQAGHANRWPRVWFWVWAAALLALAGWSLPRSIQAGDAGEFATVMLTGGVPHPSGYPWMRILGGVARGLWAIGLPPAIAAALPPALCGVGAWLLIQRTLLAIRRPPSNIAWSWLGAFVITLVASSPLVVIHVHDSEVWGPHLLFTALFIHTVIATRSIDRRGEVTSWRAGPWARAKRGCRSAEAQPSTPSPARRGEVTSWRAGPWARAKRGCRSAEAQPSTPSPARRGEVVWLGLTLGLAISHHLTAVWLIPIAVGAATPALGEGRSWRAWLIALLRNGALGFASSFVGLLPFATLPIGREGAWRWGDVRSLDGWLHHITRREYGTFSLSLHEEEVAAADTIARALTSVGEVFSAGLVESPLAGAAVLLAAIAGTWALASAVGRGVAIGWALSLALSGLGFPALQNIDPTGPFGAWILERFDLLTVLLIIIPLCAGLRQIGAMLQERLESPPKLRRAGAGAVAAVLLLAQIGAVLERGRPSTEAAVELAAIDMLETPDPHGPAIPSQTGGPSGGEPIRAIVFGTDDHRSFPALYAQAVLGAGAHTLYIDAQLLAHPWYRARLRERVPTLPDLDKPLRSIGAIWSDPALAGVPIYLANVFSEPADRLAKVPEGLLWRVVPPSDHPSFVAAEWTPEAIAARHLAAFARYRVRVEDFGGLSHPRGHPWSADLWHAYVDKSQQLAQMLLRANRQTEAQQVLDALARITGAAPADPDR